MAHQGVRAFLELIKKMDPADLERKKVAISEDLQAANQSTTTDHK